MSRPKLAVLALLAALSFASPLAEAWATGRVDTFSGFGLAETIASLVLLFCWYHFDKLERGYQAGRLMNAGVLVLAALALPIYLVRSRGWRNGAIAIAWAALYVAGTLLLGELGERLGVFLALGA